VEGGLGDLGVHAAGGEFFRFQDLGVLCGLDPGDAGLEGGFPPIAVGGCDGVAAAAATLSRRAQG
jgi:hypothetical protein